VRGFLLCAWKKPGGAALTGPAGSAGRIRQSCHPAMQTARSYWKEIQEYKNREGFDKRRKAKTQP